MLLFIDPLITNIYIYRFIRTSVCLLLPEILVGYQPCLILGPLDSVMSVQPKVFKVHTLRPHIVFTS